MNLGNRIFLLFILSLNFLACKMDSEAADSETETIPAKQAIKPKMLRDSLLSFSSDTILPFGTYQTGELFQTGEAYDLIFYSADSSQNYVLELIRDSTNQQQVLCLIDSISIEMDSIQLQFVDANFDGFRDLKIQRTEMVGMQLPTYYLFLFDPKTQNLIPVPNSLEFLGMEMHPAEKKVMGELLIHCENQPIEYIAKYCKIYGRWEGYQLIKSKPDCPCKGQILE
jgi:hypothetical protein